MSSPSVASVHANATPAVKLDVAEDDDEEEQEEDEEQGEGGGQANFFPNSRETIFEDWWRGGAEGRRGISK